MNVDGGAFDHTGYRVGRAYPGFSLLSRSDERTQDGDTSEQTLPVKELIEQKQVFVEWKLLNYYSYEKTCIIPYNGPDRFLSTCANRNKGCDRL
jgi:hypothetical protein